MSITPNNIVKNSLWQSLDILFGGGYGCFMITRAKEEVKIMDVKNDINENNKHSNEEAQGGSGGILRIQGPAARIEQENHNANHVLHYVTLVTLSITHEIRRKAGPEAAERMRAHLSCLKEFIEDSDLELSSAVHGLLEGFEKGLPASRETWITFIAGHRAAIGVLARRYGGLKNNELSKIEDLFAGRQWLRQWWWKNRLRKFCLAIKKNAATVTAMGSRFRNKIS